MWENDIYVQLWSSNGNIHGVMRTQLCTANNAEKKKKSVPSIKGLSKAQSAQQLLPHPTLKQPAENKQQEEEGQAGKVISPWETWIFIVQLSRNFESSFHKCRKMVSCYLESRLPCYSVLSWDFHRRRKKQTCDEDFRTDATSQALLHHFKERKGTKSFSKLSDWKEYRAERSISLSTSLLLFLSALSLLSPGGLQGEVMQSDANCYKMSG